MGKGSQIMDAISSERTCKRSFQKAAQAKYMQQSITKTRRKIHEYETSARCIHGRYPYGGKRSGECDGSRCGSRIIRRNRNCKSGNPGTHQPNWRGCPAACFFLADAVGRDWRSPEILPDRSTGSGRKCSMGFRCSGKQ